MLSSAPQRFNFLQLGIATNAAEKKGMWFWRAWRSSASATTKAAAQLMIRLRRTTKPVQSSRWYMQSGCIFLHVPHGTGTGTF